MANKNEAKIRFIAETDDFNKQIKNANTEMAKLREEAKLNAEQMKDTGVTVEGLQKKKQLLTKQLEQTRAKTEAMSQKVEKAKKIFGENSEEVKKLETQLLKQQTAQVKAERAVKDCTAELEAQADAANKAETENKQLGNALDDVADGADDAEKGFSKLDGTVSVFLGNALTGLVDGIKDAVSSFANLSEETMEYREDINKLKTAWESAGQSTELATKTYKDFYSVLGEEDRSIEAVNHLAKFVETEEDMAKWTNICTGVWGTFGDSLPIEGLTEASNETAKVGKLTGSLADALNWAGVNEEEFQESLDKCNNEQERTELITETLNGLYEDAAEHYKENNKSIIDARKATSNYTDAMAELGEAMEPVNTEVTKLKTEFAKEFTPVLKKDVIPAVKGFLDELKEKGTVSDLAKVVGNITKTVLPPFAKIVGFAADNFGTLVKVIGTAVVTYKTFSAAMAVSTAIQGATTAVAGLSAGVGIATTVQTAWNAAMVANPIGALVTAIGLLVGGLVLLATTQETAVVQTDILTEEEKQLAEAADNTAQSFRDQQAATEETIGGIMAEMDHIKLLSGELDTLVDAKGRVAEKDEARVQFILNELNEALGTEYSLTNGVVQKYSELKKNIDAVIQSKTANALLEAGNADYVAAVQAEADALHNVNLKEKEWQDQKRITLEKEAEYATEKERLRLLLQGAQLTGNYFQKSIYRAQLGRLDGEMNAVRDAEAQKKQEYDNALENYGNYHNTIMNYEEAQTAALQGNYDRAVEILKNKSGSYNTYADNVSQSSREAIDALYKEAVDAGIEAERTKRNFENGVEGYTAEMVTEAADGYEKALKEWATAYDNAHAVGTDLGGGLKAGMEGTQLGLIQKAKSMVANIISAFRNAADSHSPSRKMIDFGEDMGEGGEIGLENKTGDMVKVAKNQVKDLLKVYNGASDIVQPFGTANAKIGGISAQDRANINAATVVDNKLQGNGLLAYVQAVEKLANRAIELNINGKHFATATASDSDAVNGSRVALSKMGLAIG